MDKNTLQPFVTWTKARHQRRYGTPMADRTVTTYLGKLGAMASLVGASDPVVLCAVVQDRERVEHLVDALTARCTPGTVRGYLYCLLTFAEWAKSSGEIKFVAVFKSDIPAPTAAKHTHCYTLAEIDQIISAARYDLRWWMLLATVADTGRRIGEVLDMRWSDFRLDMNPPHVELPTTKSRKPQFMLLTSRLLNDVFTLTNIETLASERRTGRRTFERDPAVYTFPMTYSNAMKRLETHCARLGLPYRGFHNFRHALISERIRRGVPLSAVSAMAGHSSVHVTNRYYDQTVALHYGQYVDLPPEVYPIKPVNPYGHQ